MSEGSNCWLQLNSFDETVKTFWQKFQDEKDFCDVTLACEDKQIKTHKIIISSYSPILGNILKLNSNPHPLIYLKGVKFRDLQSLLHFMYQGGVNVAVEEVPSFLEMAKDLLIRGLSEGNMEGDDTENVESLEDIHKNNVMTPEEKRTGNSARNSQDFFPESVVIDDDFDHTPRFDTQSKEANQEVKKEKSKQSLISADGTNQFICKSCNNDFLTKGNLLKHIRSIHYGIRYPCKQCDYKALQKGHLKEHIQSIHEGVCYPCEQCEYKATKNSDLGKHLLSMHYGVRYPCKHCDYKATQMNHLKEHTQSIHEGVRHPCKKCNYMAKNKGYLKDHIQSIHEGVRYPCKQCDYKATQMGHLKIHIQSIHEGVRHPCKKCTYMAKFKGDLKKHVLKKHN